MGSGVYEYVCGGSLGDLRNFFLTLFFSFSLYIMEPFSFLCVSQIFFLKILSFSLKVIFYVLFPFPVNICLVFSLRGLSPKEGALSQTAMHVSHVTHVTLL